MKEITIKNMYRFVTAVILIACVLWGLGEYIGINRMVWVYFALGCVTTLFLTLWCRLNAKGRLILVLSLIVAVVASAREALVWANAEKLVGAILIAVVCFGICLINEQIKWTKAAVACVFLGVLAFDLFGDRKMSHMGVVCVLLYIVLVLAEWTEMCWKKVRVNEKGHFVAGILPFLALYFVLMTIMPAPEDPYDWRFVREIIYNMNEAFKEISRNWINRNREDFDFGNSGFDANGNLLAGISDENKTLMLVQGQAGLKTNVYLTGKIYDTFDGMGWENTNESTMSERELDALETLYAVRCYDLEGESKYIEKTGLKIWYEDFRTEYLFAPLKTVRMHNLEIVDYSMVGGNYFFDEKQGYGLDYQTTFLQLNVDHPLFYEFLEKEIIDDAKIFEEAQLDSFKKVKYTLTDMDNHRESIYGIYGKPVNLSEETSKWLSEITKGSKTDIDSLKAIEAALQQMTYTKTPGNIPGYVDTEGEFLDYFLLESECGYCVYYASAFVLLARAQGLPARYVEGFCVPVPGTYKVHVTSDMAHAWPEVYIEDIGWIPFEPTPGYSEIRYTPWAIQTDVIGAGEGYIASGDDVNMEDETEGKVEEQQEKEIVDEELPDAANSSVNVLKIIGFTILFAVIVGCLILIVDRITRRSRMKHYSPKERFVAEIAVNMRLLEVFGYERKENETLSELRDRAWAIMDGDDGEEKPEFLFLKLYEEYLYGQYPIKAEMLEVLAIERQYLMQMIKKWKPIMYYYLQFYYNIF